MTEHPINTLSFSTQASLEELLSIAQTKFPVRFETIKISDHSLQILQIADMEAYIDHLEAVSSDQKGVELPFWAKIWPTSILLSYYIQKLPQSTPGPLLEIGAGVGVCGLFAAKHGFEVTISDNNEDALLFSQINILKNDLSSKARVALLDFTRDVLPTRFPYIFGSEVLYQEASYQLLVNFLNRHISHTQTAEIVLAKNYTLSAKNFFHLAQQDFHISEKVIGYKEDTTSSKASSEKHLSQIYRLRPKIL